LSRDAPRPFIHVVAAAVIDATGRVLIAQRPAGKHLAGGWEFPGGKLEPGEERLAGLARELREELGITIAAPRPLIRVRHTYSSREVLLDIWVVKRYRGEPEGLDGQALRWCTQEELGTADLLPADKPIVAALRLPEQLMEASSPLYNISDSSSIGRGGCGAEVGQDARLSGVFCASLAEAATATRAGADFLVLREVLPLGELATLVQLVCAPVYVRGISLAEAWALGASGTNEINNQLFDIAPHGPGPPPGARSE
jgi:8-oxo-dGTP diphosphatase